VADPAQLEDGELDLDQYRMTIGEHLEELRWHVLRGVIAVALLAVLCLSFQEEILAWATYPHVKTTAKLGEVKKFPGAPDDLQDLLSDTSKRHDELDAQLDAVEGAQARLAERVDPSRGRLEVLAERQRELAASLDQLAEETEALADADEVDPVRLSELRAKRDALGTEAAELTEAYQKSVAPFRDEHAKIPPLDLKQLKYQEAFLSALKLSLVVALFIGSPYLIYELWRFVSKGLYPHERRYARIFAPLSLLSFGCGILFGYYILIPLGLQFLLDYGEDALVGSSIALGDYLSLFIRLTLVVGLVFELPLVMTFLSMIGIMNAERFRKFFAAMLEAGVYLAPSPFEAGFVSLAHKPRDVEATLEAARRALRRAARVR